MIEINLLPISLREKRRKIELPPVTFIVVGGGILALLLLATVILAATTYVKGSRLQKVEEKFKKLEPESEQIAYLKDEKQKLQKKMTVIEQLVDKRILWARKLNELSSLIPPQVWLTSLFIEERSSGAGSKENETEKKKFLVIKAVAISRGEGETGELGLVGDFMDEIRKDSSFCADFTNVERRGPIRRSEIGGSETMHFELSCPFREGR